MVNGWTLTQGIAWAAGAAGWRAHRGLVGGVVDYTPKSAAAVVQSCNVVLLLSRIQGGSNAEMPRGHHRGHCGISGGGYAAGHEQSQRDCCNVCVEEWPLRDRKNNRPFSPSRPTCVTRPTPTRQSTHMIRAAFARIRPGTPSIPLLANTPTQPPLCCGRGTIARSSGSRIIPSRRPAPPPGPSPASPCWWTSGRTRTRAAAATAPAARPEAASVRRCGRGSARSSGGPARRR